MYLFPQTTGLTGLAVARHPHQVRQSKVVGDGAKILILTFFTWLHAFFLDPHLPFLPKVQLSAPHNDNENYIYCIVSNLIKSTELSFARLKKITKYQPWLNEPYTVERFFSHPFYFRVFGALKNNCENKTVGKWNITNDKEQIKRKSWK